MATLQKGKFLLPFLLFILFSQRTSRVFVKSNPNSIENDQETVDYGVSLAENETATSDKQEALLLKLEELVKNLSEVVSKLESRLSEPSKTLPLSADSSSRLVPEIKDEIDLRNREDKRSVVELEVEGDVKSEAKLGVSVTKYSPFWSERFQFVSAVNLDSDATSVNVLPFRDYEGLSKYVSVGDSRGRVYVFLRNGDVLVEFHTTCDSPVTTMVSYLSVYKNESFVVTGHENGAILLHRIHERFNGEEWSSLSMENVGKFEGTGGCGEDEEEGGLAINILEVHHVGRMRYILSTDLTGEIVVYRENGTIHGSVTPTSKPIAFLKQRLLFLTESGAGSLDLRTMKVRESECEGLNRSLARNYVFDATERSKAYGFTSDGDLIHVILLGDIMNFKCRVRSKKKFDIVGKPLAFQVIKGYLLVVNEEKVFVYNVSTQHYVRVGGPRLLFSAGLDEIRSSFLNQQGTHVKGARTKIVPLIASDREKLVVLGLGGGYVGMYRSNLPVFKGDFNTMLWTSPVLFFVIFLFGAWHFFAKKKEALTSWGPDDPFSSTQPPDRSFVDSSSRNTDIMELRNSGLRGPTRRYVSPSRYQGVAAGSYRQTGTDPSARPAASVVDPNFRTASELKYRGQPPPLEPTGFPKRREGLFVNNSQVVDDNS